MKLPLILSTACIFAECSLSANDSHTPTVTITDVFAHSPEILHCYLSFKMPKSMGYMASRFGYFNQNLNQEIDLTIKNVTLSPIKAKVGILKPTSPNHSNKEYDMSMTIYARTNKILPHLKSGKYEVDVNGYVELYVGKNIANTPYISIEKKASVFSEKKHGASYEWLTENEFLISWNNTFFADRNSIKFYSKDKILIDDVKCTENTTSDHGHEFKFVFPTNTKPQFMKIEYITNPITILKIPIRSKGEFNWNQPKTVKQ